MSAEAKTQNPQQRGGERTDRRRQSRSGRRASDPRVNWRRWAWLFAAYAVFMSIRALPAAAKKRLFGRSTGVPS